ncbi:Protein MEI2-like 4 (OML4) (MEI2-like protein 4) [Durusdinium trenchii]|uniref:Protein MEI2-like 4 (OML4) (MEI2-like protein 4) n=1 Tax=Durusdinium trenchii TaxID=1381693 RepID=A0ABP0NAV8_9DINO
MSNAQGFVATSYLAKKEDDPLLDVSTVLKGVSAASLEALNYVDYLNKKYEVSNKVGTAVNEALDSNQGETTTTVKDALGTVNGAIDSFDKDVGIKDTLGSLVLAGSDLAGQLATKVVELNTEYKARVMESDRTAALEKVTEALTQGTSEEGPLVCSLLAKELEGTRFEHHWISQDGKGQYRLGEDGMKVAVQVLDGKLLIHGYFEGCLVIRSTFFHLETEEEPLTRRFHKLRRHRTEGPWLWEPKAEKVYEIPAPTPAEPPAPEIAVEEVKKPKERTTVMLRNLPNNYTREMFLQLLDEQGMKGLYDFVYLPCDFYRDANLGYAFVNMVHAQAVEFLWRTFHGFSDWALPTAKVCEVRWSGPHQGLRAHVDRYRNSPVMHKSVPDDYKPMIFKDGVRKAFPRPTKKVKAPFDRRW